MPAILAFVLALLTCATAFAEGQFRVDRDTVFYEDVETGEKLAIFRHKGLELDDENRPVRPIQGPIEVDGRWHYSVAADVLEVDVEAGQIARRTHYSMYIRELRIGDEGELEVVVEYDDGAEQMVFEHIGESPGRALWQDGIRTSFRALRDVTAYLDEKEWETSAEDRSSVAGLLRTAAERDRTNPFYYAYLGRFAHLDDDAAKANAYFAKALEVEAPWFDTIRLCGMLHVVERIELARKTCSRALDQMMAEKIRPDAMLGLITFAATTVDLRESMKKAVETSDHARADAIAEDLFRLFPMIESSHQAWRILADWFESEGKSELASKWRSRSIAVEESPITQTFWGGARTVDRMILISATTLLLLPIAAVLIGLRTSRRKPDIEGPKKWLPRPTLAEVISIVLVVALAIYAGHKAAKHITMIGEFASLPITLISEGHGSPEAVSWLEEQSEGPARDELLAYGRYEQKQAREGARLDRAPPSPETLVRLVDRDSAESAWEGFLTSGSFGIFERAASIRGTPSAPSAPSVPPGLPVLISFMFFLFVGAAASRLLPGVARRAGWLVPGGSVNAGWATPWILGAFIGGALWAFTPMGTILREIASPAFPKYFGLEAVAGTDFFMRDGLEAWLPWTLFFGSLLVHAVLVFLDRKSLAAD